MPYLSNEFDNLVNSVLIFSYDCFQVFSQCLLYSFSNFFFFFSNLGWNSMNRDFFILKLKDSALLFFLILLFQFLYIFEFLLLLVNNALEFLLILLKILVINFTELIQASFGFLHLLISQPINLCSVLFDALLKRLLFQFQSSLFLLNFLAFASYPISNVFKSSFECLKIEKMIKIRNWLFSFLIMIQFSTIYPLGYIFQFLFFNFFSASTCEHKYI